ncbi:MAG: TraR/DksA C4-type zinc finger protein [Hydrogenophaga sp.]|uniref:TraR/DksA C4-type zinc finger protein n=1 Tax=Hydrogenophaga sp. TaxID=1904254 RepID=UPI00257C7248|nr:TraR/DksA C4-type zinc finger protein [Hydrogenophaga sp.]MBL0944695.1 TraR/DksA C4-type zinc finger protein [Hydrogenophaga sp.]
MSATDPARRPVNAELRALLHQRRERLIARLCRGNLPLAQADEIVEEMDRLDSAMARLGNPGPDACARCGEPISITRRTLSPDAELCTACSLLPANGSRSGREGPTSTWDVEWLPELG